MIDQRLKSIFDLLKEGMIVADIGTDHAFLPIELILKNKARKVYACDVVSGPLNIAKKNIEEFNLQDRIHVIKSDGLIDVPGDCEAIVIAGMGYYTVKKILEDSLEKLKSYKQIIIQVNSDVDLFRKWISDHNYTIVNEKMVKVKHYYTIIEFNLSYRDGYSEDEIQFGPILIKSKDKVFIEYLIQKKDKLFKLTSKITDNHKVNKYLDIIERIKKILL